ENLIEFGLAGMSVNDAGSICRDTCIYCCMLRFFELDMSDETETSVDTERINHCWHRSHRWRGDSSRLKSIFCQRRIRDERGHRSGFTKYARGGKHRRDGT